MWYVSSWFMLWRTIKAGKVYGGQWVLGVDMLNRVGVTEHMKKWGRRPGEIREKHSREEAKQVQRSWGGWGCVAQTNFQVKQLLGKVSCWRVFGRNILYRTRCLWHWVWGLNLCLDLNLVEDIRLKFIPSFRLPVAPFPANVGEKLFWARTKMKTWTSQCRQLCRFLVGISECGRDALNKLNPGL